MSRRMAVTFYLCACGVAIFLINATLNFPKTLAYRGAGDWPLVILVCLAGVSVLLLIETLRSPSLVDSQALSGARPARLLTALVALIAYTLLLPTAGFLVLTPLFLAGMMWLLGERRPAAFILIPIGSTIVAFIFFQRIMQLMLPRGFGIFRWVTEALS